MAKDKEYNRLIHSTRWLRLRRAKLTADPLCERCLSQGRVAVATEVHHVKPVEEGLTYGEKSRLMYDYHNLQSLCAECHDKAHTEMGRSGKAAAKRMAAAQIERFRERFLE